MTLIKALCYLISFVCNEDLALDGEQVMMSMQEILNICNKLCMVKGRKIQEEKIKYICRNGSQRVKCIKGILVSMWMNNQEIEKIKVTDEKKCLVRILALLFNR